MSPITDSPSGVIERHIPATAPQEHHVARPSAKALERQELLDAFAPSQLRWNNLSWVVITFIVGMHVAALAAPFFFTWSALVAALVLHWATCSIGICLGYHRGLSHKSLKLRNPAKFIATYFGVISGEGTPLMWAATHRVHHSRSDKEGDPHSPYDGTWWSHIMWTFVKNTPRKHELLIKQYAPDLAQDPMLQMFERTYAWWLWSTAFLLYAAGAFFFDGGALLSTVGLSWVLWAFCLRTVVAYHSTWFVNSATHIWGYRNYDTTDHSRNLWWVAVAAYGEGWHNNHHAHPRLARAGHRWWELDPTWWSISALRLVGQAYDVDDRIPDLNSREAEEE